MVRKVWPYVGCGLACLVSVLAIVFLGGVWVVASAGVIGCVTAGILVLILALPPLLSPPDAVHRMTAGMFTISYSCAVVIPVISGALWDMTGSPGASFVPLGLCTLATIGLAPSVVLRDKPAAPRTWR
jgi:CP family cyanate transporter-like MFS transporter